MGAGRNPQATADSTFIAPLSSKDPDDIMSGVICPVAHAEKSDFCQSQSTAHVRHTGGQIARSRETNQIKYNNIPTITPLRSVKGRINRWMADTGASVDALDIHMLSKAGRRKARKLHIQCSFDAAASQIDTNSSIELRSV